MKRELKRALAEAALSDDGSVKGIPFEYALDALAQRWNCPPWVIEQGPIEWLIRGLEFQTLEASVKRKRG